MGENQKKWAIVGAVCLLIVGAYWYFIYQKQDATIKQLEAQIEKLSKEIKTAESKVAKLEELEKNMKVLEAEWLEALKYLPTQDDIETLVKTIELAIRDSNLKKFNFTPGKPKEAEFYSEQDIKMTLEGDYKAMLTFLNHLERFDRVVHPKKFNAKLKTDRNKPGKNFNLTLSMDITTYIAGGESDAK